MSDLPTIPSDNIANLAACPVCGHEERTPVCRFNRFAMFASQPDERAGIYSYALCHGCGVVYATRRPEGPHATSGSSSTSTMRWDDRKGARASSR
jgi:hypothetical protein